MTSAALDRLLAVLVLALATTGLVSLRMGAPGDTWLFVLHGVLAGALTITVTMKIGRSMPKAVRAGRWGRVALGLLVSLVTVATLVGGFAWVTSGQLLAIGSWTVLTIRAWIGLMLVPLVVVHLPPTVRAQRDGVPVEWRSVDLFHVRDGKLSEHWVHEVDQDLVDRFWS